MSDKAIRTAAKPRWKSDNKYNKDTHMLYCIVIGDQETYFTDAGVALKTYEDLQMDGTSCVLLQGDRSSMMKRIR